MMRNWVTAWALLLIVCAGALGADNDWQIWSDLKVKASLGDRVDFTFKPAVRWRDNGNDFYYTRYDAGFKVVFNENWAIEPFYSFRRKDGSSGWDHSDLFSTHLFYTCRLGDTDFKFENRIRLEKNFDTEREAGRERIKLSRDIEAFKGLSVFAGDEIIYDFSGGDFKENRLQAGVKKKLDGGLSLEAAYQLTSLRDAGHWEDYDTLVLSLGLDI